MIGVSEAYRLKDNPFAKLRLSARASVSEIEDAFEDAVIARPAEEPALLKIKQQLLTPNARLAAELSWLSDTAPRRAEQLIAMMDAGNVRGLLDAAADLPPVTAANIAAGAAAQFQDPRFVPILVDAHRRIEPVKSLDALNSTRATAGFARVEPAQMAEALKALRQAHAQAALEAITAQRNPPLTLAQLLSSEADPHDLMLMEIVRGYDHWSSPHLGEIERDIEAALDSLMKEEAGAAARVTTLLAAWDDLSQPAQLFSQLSGLDEERSLRIYRRVRGCCVDLANDHGRYEDAHTITTAMRELFKELPTANAELAADVETLADLTKRQRLDQLLAPLVAAIDYAKEEVARVTSGLKGYGFEVHAGVRVAQLRTAYIEALGRVEGGEHADAPTRLVRSLALELNNEHDDPAAALALLQGIAGIATPTDKGLAAQITDDIATSQNNVDHRRLTAALEAKKLGDAIRIVDVMVARNRGGEEGAGLVKLQQTLRQQRTKRYLKWGAGAAFVAFVLYGMVQNSSAPSSLPTTAPTTIPDPKPPATTAPVAVPETSTITPDASSSVTPDEANGDQATDVSTPPIGTDVLLSGSQVRYCLFEKARLNALRSLVSPTNTAALGGFNARIDDYNGRCGSYRYQTSDFESASAAVVRDADRLASEARAIADGWAQ